MKRTWDSLGIGTKLRLLIQALLLLVLLGAQAWVTQRFREHVLQAAESRAQVSADGVINGMNMLMVTGMISDPDNRRLYIRKMAASEGVAELRIIRARQVQDQFGPGLPEEQPVDALDRLAIDSKRPQFRLQADERPQAGNGPGSRVETRPTLRVVVPFIVSTDFRGTNCLRCHHVQAGSVNGAASITLDLSGDFALIARIERMLWAGQIALQLTLFVLLGWLTRHFIRPLRQLQSVMTAMRDSGDLSGRSPDELQVRVRGRDEVGKLTEAFNAMALDLRDQVLALRDAQNTQQRYLAQSRDEQARLVALLSAMDIGILFVSREHKVIQVNPAFLNLWRIPATAALVGADIQSAFAHSTCRVVSPPGFLDGHPLRTPESIESREITFEDGRIVSIYSFDVRDGERDLAGWLWIFEDVTDARRSAEQLIFLAEHDVLTGLQNRRLFHQELDRVLNASQRSGAMTAVLLLDLDGFKYANDNFGHGAGDTILIRVAAEIGAQIRRSERLFRLGGDEFTILVPDTSEDEVKVLAERVVRAVARIPFAFEGSHVRMTASVGIALHPLNSSNASELVAHADTAMYQAKESGKNTWRVYEAQFDSSREMLSRMSIEEGVERAIAEGRLRLHFQGIYHTDGRLSHLEALVRMVDQHDPATLLLPAAFIPIAERSGRIRALDRWVLREVMALLASSPHIPSIAVNVSGRTIDDATLPQFIRDEIARHRIEPRRLVVELTETSAFADLTDAQGFIESLRETGCRICLDDFGSGFSSFVYLKYLNADILKIDGAFIHNLPHDHENQVFVQAIVAVARGLKKITVAEFVEDAETLLKLTDFGVDLVQGYFFDRPQADHPALLEGARDGRQSQSA